MTPAEAARELELALAQCRALVPDDSTAVALSPPEQPLASGDAPAPPTGAASGPRWEPLVMVPIPGLREIAAIAKPPLEVVRAILGVIRAFAQALAAILVGLLDPLRAIVLAAYEALNALVNDLIHAGAYLYLDPLSWNEVLPTPQELGIPVRPEEPFRAGMGGKPPPPKLDGWTTWATRFGQSFDDPGDDQRPILSDGASVTALFLVWAAPSFDVLARLLHALGWLLNIDAWKLAFDQFSVGPDPSLAAARGTPRGTAPNWQRKGLVDLFPPIEGLTALPKLLLEILKAGDGLVALLNGLVTALTQKIAVIQQIIDMIDAVLALLDALSITGIKSLFVTSNQGVRGLKQAFLTAANRPEGAHVAGICFLAAGPGLKDATVLWELFGQGKAFTIVADAYDQMAENAEDDWDRVEAAAGALEDTATRAADAFADAVVNAPAGALGGLVEAGESVYDAAAAAPNALVDKLEQAGATLGGDAIEAGRQKVAEVRKRALGSLAAGHGAKGGGGASR